MAILTAKKTILILIAVIVIAGGAVFLLNKSDGKDANTGSNNAAPSATTAAEVKTYDPTEILKNPKDYIDQEIKLKGTVIQINNPKTKDYFLVGSGDEKLNAIKLDFSKSNIDPSQYANIGSNSKEPPKPGSDDTSVTKPAVTLQGKILQESPDKNIIPVFEVTSVE